MTTTPPPKPSPHHAWPMEVVAANIRARRAALELSQADLASRMKYLGAEWHQQTVARVESRKRSLAAEELPSLALALETTVTDLFNVRAAGGWLLLSQEQDEHPVALKADDVAGWLSGDALVEWSGHDMVSLVPTTEESGK